VFLTANHDGFWLAEARAGDEVTAGQALGSISNVFGGTLEVIEAPHDGVVLYRTTSLAVKAGGVAINVSW
jgi:predicted deacylase